MTIIRNVVLAVLVVAFAVPSQAQQLTQTEIEQAVAFGLKTKPDKIGLSIRPLSLGWAETQLLVYTPVAWVQLMASEAAAAHKPFLAKDIDGAAVAPILRVQFKPGESVENIVLRDVAKQQQPIQPLETKVCGQRAGFGGRTIITCFEAQFSMSDIRTLVEADDGEFIITVAVEGDSLSRSSIVDKDFRVRRSHHSKLPGLK